MKCIYGRQYFFLKSNENQDFSSDEISFRVNDSSFPTLCELCIIMHFQANIVSNSQQGCNGGMPFTESRDGIEKKMGVKLEIYLLSFGGVYQNFEFITGLKFTNISVFSK